MLRELGLGGVSDPAAEAAGNRCEALPAQGWVPAKVTGTWELATERVQERRLPAAAPIRCRGFSGAVAGAAPRL